MIINVIAAVAANRAIGYRNKLLYWLPDDLARFKSLTDGHTVIMGSNTFKSLPKGALPNRRNIVLSRKQTSFEGCETYKSLEEAIAHCKADEEVYIIGGASVYEKSLSIANKLYMTEVHDVPKKADTFFPKYNEWKEIWREEHPVDGKHKYSYAFVNYIKK